MALANNAELKNTMTLSKKIGDDGVEQRVQLFELGELLLAATKDRRKVQKQLTKEFSDAVGRPVEDLSQTLERANARDAASEEENRKDKQAENRNFLSSVGGFFTEPLSDLKESFNGLTDGLLGKAGITTLIVLAITGLLAFFRPAAELFAAGITAFAGTFSGAASFLRDPTGDNFFKFLSDEFLGISMTLALALTVFRNIIKKISVVFFKLIAIPMLIFNVVESVVDRVMNAFEQDYNVGGIIGSFIDGLIIGFFDGLKNVLNLLFDLLLPDDIAASFKNAISGFFDGITSFFTEGNFFAGIGNFIGKLLGAEDTPEGMAIGGPVAAGTPYIVGEKGPELFVPGAAGGIMPGLGGGNIVVNNNQVNQSAQTANHQHSNVTIVDRQQEQTGL